MVAVGNEWSRQRNANVEVLRCLLMFLIVCYHCFISGPCAASKSIWTFVFTVLTCWHVDGFLAISGWYGIKFKWGKVLALLCHFTFYGVLSSAYCYWMRGNCDHCSLYYFGAWFGSSYLVLMLLSPLINRVFESGWEKCRRLVLMGVGLLAAVLFVSWITGRFGAGMIQLKSFGVHSVLLMVYLYCVARVLRKLFEARKPRLKWLLVCMAVFVIALPIHHLVDVLHRRMTGTGIYGIGAYFAAFDAPHTVMMAFAVLLLFVNYVRLPQWCGNLATRLSPYLFGVYLCHATTSFGGRFYEVEHWLVNTLHLHGFFAVILTAVFIFVVCIGVELARKSCVRLCTLSFLKSVKGKSRE